MRFTKMHGLGNDYIVVEWVEFAREIGRKNSEILECKFPEKHPEAEQALRTWIQHACDRHFGIGADGVLIICPSQTADFRMLIYNADGSRAQMCGNGIRCCAKYMWDSGGINIAKNLKNKRSGNILRKKKYICTQSGCKVKKNSIMNNRNNVKLNESGNYKPDNYEFKYQSGNEKYKIQENNDEKGEKCQCYMKIDTDSGVKTVKILKNIRPIKSIIPIMRKRHLEPDNKKTEILVNMGRPSTDYEHLKINFEDCSYTIIPVSMGNLHAVVFLDEEEALWDNQKIIEGNKRKKSIEAENLENRSMEIDLKKRIEYENLKDMQKNVECDENKSNTDKYTRLAAYIQHLDYFADGVNVEFAQILDSSHIQMRVWERGVGETLACGTGACAVCVAAVKITMEKTEKSGSDINTDVAEKHRQYIHIKLRGGTLRILWTPGEDVWMAGPAVTVFEGKYWC